MAFAQNIVRDRRRRIHSRARGHGRCLRPGRVAVERPSPSSGCRRTDSDTAANRQRHASAQSDATISRGWSGRPHGGYPGSDGLRTSKGAAVRSSSRDPKRYPPDAAATTDPDPHDPSHPDADG